MDGTTSCEIGVRHLTVVLTPSPEQRLGSGAEAISLRGAPYRPGELPYPFELKLPGKLAPELNAQAQRRRLPAELVVRAQLDASRALSRLASSDAERVSVIRALDTAADEFAPSVLGGGDLERYRRLLLAGDTAAQTAVSAGGEVELLVPLELRVAWQRDAAVASKRVDEWAAELLTIAPACAIEWEAAAAASGLRLCEWAYDAWRR